MQSFRTPEVILDSLVVSNPYSTHDSSCTDMDFHSADLQPILPYKQAEISSCSSPLLESSPCSMLQLVNPTQHLLSSSIWEWGGGMGKHIQLLGAAQAVPCFTSPEVTFTFCTQCHDPSYIIHSLPDESAYDVTQCSLMF